MNWDMIKNILDQVGVYNFDPSNTEFIVAGYPVTDFTTISVVAGTKVKSEQGTDASYHTYVRVPAPYKISFSLLAVCKDLIMIEKLQQAFDKMGGGFDVIVKTQGRYIGDFRCYFESDSSDLINDEANDKVYDMVAIKVPDIIRQGATND